MHQRTPAYPGDVTPEGESGYERGPSRRIGRIHASRTQVEAWPDSDRWPEPERPLPAYHLEGFDNPAPGGRSSPADSARHLAEIQVSPHASQHPSIAPQSMDVNGSELDLPRPRPTRRLVTAFLAALVGTPFLVLAVYALATRGLGAWQPSGSQGVANAAQTGQWPVRLEHMSPEERAYRTAGDAMSHAAEQTGLACRVPGAPPASLWVTVSFAPSGNVDSVSIEGTPPDSPQIGQCVEQRLRELRIARFQGEPVQVARAISVK